MANYFEGLQFNIIYSSRKSIAIELRMEKAVSKNARQKEGLRTNSSIYQG